MEALTSSAQAHYSPYGTTSPKADLRIDTLASSFKVFKDRVFFHGTNVKSAHSIEKHGMNLARKVDGCASLLKAQTGIDDPAAHRFNYVMSIESAANYAKMHKNPAILAIFVPSSIHLENDPEGYNPDEMRTPAHIPEVCILNSAPLSQRRCDYILGELNVRLTPDNQNKLFDKIDEYVQRQLRKVPRALKGAVSFLDMERERDSATLEAIRQQQSSGMFSDFKEGDTFSIEW